MDQENETTAWQGGATGAVESALPPRFAPYETSLVGEYVRLILLLLAFPLMALFARSVANQQPGILCLVAATLLFSSLITPRGYQILRVCLLVAMAMNVLALVINPDEAFGKIEDAPSGVATYVLLCCLVAASYYEIRAWIKSCSRKTLIKTMAWGILAVPALAYVVGIPAIEFVWDAIQGNEKKAALKDPNWSLMNEAAFRAAKFGVFAVFTYLGACVGSFLNVVAYCIPRGESIGLRDSKCPGCDTKIKRIDNLPIFSYVNLGARCRSCSVPISVRYLIVELVVALIFGSLFLYELVTGCANVPKINIYHDGILWIILYPKWPAIAIYFYHTFFMSLLLVLSLIEWDKQPLKLFFSTLVALAFLVAAAVYDPIQPIPLLEHLPGGSTGFPLWLEQLVKLTVGAIIGAALGRLFGKAYSASNLFVLTFAYSLTGVVLGWQALLQVTVFFGILTAVARALPETSGIHRNPTMILLVAVSLHHPVWKIIANWWRWF